jgi:hypothetical protein
VTLNPLVSRQTGFRHRYQLGAVLILLLWGAALFLPVTIMDHAAIAGGSATAHGYILGLEGWAGPLGLNVAWYANIPLLFTAADMIRGRPPNFTVTVVTLFMALDALIPVLSYDFEVEGDFHANVISGPALWVWLLAFAVNFALGLQARDERAEAAVVQSSR